MATRLDPPPASLFSTTSFDDWAHSLRFTALNTDATNSQYRIQVSVDALLNPLSITTFGIVLTGGAAFQRVGSCCNAMPPLPLPTLPDLDLHLFADDGRHVGINYATGQFENQIDNTEVSGDQFNGHEWIVSPASTPGVHFVVSDLKALQFLMEFPQFQAALGSTDTFTLNAVAAAPGGSPSTVGTNSRTIPIGGFLEVPLIKTQNPDGTIKASPGEPRVTIDSLTTELNSYFAAGAIKTADAYGGLKDKLIAAKGSIAAGMRNTAINQLTAFQNQLHADSLVINRFAFQRMMVDSQTLIDYLAGA